MSAADLDRADHDSRCPMSEFRVTFGQQYRRETHPRWLTAHPDGWLTIVAEDLTAAREVARYVLGPHWCFVYPADDDTNWSLFPLGELGRVEQAVVR